MNPVRRVGYTQWALFYAIFSVVDAVLFRPLPYPQPDRLLWISTMTRTPRGEFEDTSQDGRTWEYLRDHARTVDVGVYSAISRNVVLAAPGGGAQYVKQQRVFRETRAQRLRLCALRDSFVSWE